MEGTCWKVMRITFDIVVGCYVKNNHVPFKQLQNNEIDCYLKTMRKKCIQMTHCLTLFLTLITMADADQK